MEEGGTRFPLYFWNIRNFCWIVVRVIHWWTAFTVVLVVEFVEEFDGAFTTLPAPPALCSQVLLLVEFFFCNAAICDSSSLRSFFI